MRDIGQLTTYINETIEKKILPDLIDAQRETAEQIQEDAIAKAPKDTGAYAKSIKVGKTKIEGKEISTEIFTDLVVGEGKWSTVPLGTWLEYGTGIVGQRSNKIDHDFEYRQTPWVYFNERLNRFVFTEGMVARPHFYFALQKNIGLYEKKILEAIE